MRIETLLDSATLLERIDALAGEIAGDYAGRDPIVAGVLKGSIQFFSELTRRLPEHWRLDMLQVGSYDGGTESSGIVQMRKDLDLSIEGEDVILVEDIVDRGYTIAHLRELLSTRHPRSIAVATLLSKPDARRVEVDLEYVGFEIPEVFVIGFGLDYKERYRGLPDVAVLHLD